jgi:cytochrome P450
MPALRLYPIFPEMSRIALRDMTLPVGGGPNQYQPTYVEKGTWIQTSFMALHRNQSVFGPDVEEFVLERWANPRSKQW